MRTRNAAAVIRDSAVVTKTRGSRERLKAETESVEDLVRMVLAGRVRTPPFQRGLRWQSKHVLDLLDSILRGYPVGSLLFHRAPAQADRLTLGPIAIDASSDNSALWVVDGQQRLTALAVALGRPGSLPTTPDDPWVVWFDAPNDGFVTSPRDAAIESTWVPLPELLDPTRLQDWVYRWEHRDDTLRRAVFDASRQIREYRIPYYVIEGHDESALREVFYRTNKSGQPLKWTEVHDALFGHRSPVPSTLKQLADDVATLRMGRPEESLLLKALIASRGRDVTGGMEAQLREKRGELANMVRDGAGTIRRCLDFLRRNAAIPHLRLLPRREPLIVLARLLQVHPEPKARSRELLGRWIWRLLAGELEIDEQTLLRRSIAAVDDDEEGTVQKLLRLAPARNARRTVPEKPFDARQAESRLVGLALASLAPRDLETGSHIDLGALLEDTRAEAFRRVVAGAGGLHRTASNRVMHPGTGAAKRDILEHARTHGNGSEVLASHAIDADAMNALVRNDITGFLEKRGAVIGTVLDDLIRRRSSFGSVDRDRPSLDYVLKKTGGD